MRFFVITVARPGCAGKDISVEARNMTEAKRKALAMVGCSNSDPDEWDYEVTNVMVYPRGEVPPTPAAPAAAAAAAMPALPALPDAGDAWI
jgi:hypothetical protein